MHAGLSEDLTFTDSFSQNSLPDSYPFFHVLVHFLSFLLKMNVAFAAYATAKTDHFRRNCLEVPQFLSAYTPAAVLLRPLHFRLQIDGL